MSADNVITTNQRQFVRRHALVTRMTNNSSGAHGDTISSKTECVNGSLAPNSETGTLCAQRASNWVFDASNFKRITKPDDHIGTNRWPDRRTRLASKTAGAIEKKQPKPTRK